MRTIAVALLLLLMHGAVAQTVSASLPKPIDKKGRYLFYLHGGVVTVLGDNAINRGAPEWGLHEVMLNTGLNHGFFYKGRKDWIDPIMEWLATARE